MTKEAALDLVVKAFGVGLLVAALAAIPALVEGMAYLSITNRIGPKADDPDVLGDYWNMAESAHFASILGALARLLVFALAGYNFLRSGSWVRRLMGQPVEQAAAADGPNGRPAR